ncbi:alpha/beta hydrolase family protein [Winogradskyella immobilis]|uniref:Dienelactone hydrolase domain-containing protein n=1 Tax=Winogradskyella immobilis TaxID=2816852 RepID=A0ABS8EMC6_9FLAO|nr:hypothetical protein [Winogradskyella immobilis]MCC1484374.1 hypothetical protein [Winogradskyella immobilis]MCG0016466.1 hypothetical protein [Winogradskyella immobilis]
MRTKYISLLFIFIISMGVNAQDYSEVIEIYKECFKDKSGDKLKPYLSSDFTISGVSNKEQIPLALNQLFTQLPLTSLTVKETNTTNTLINYNFNGLGERTSAMHFNDKRKITKIELFDNLVNESRERRNAKPNPDKELSKKYPSKKVTFKVTDKRTVYGELYEVGKDSSVILLCHQSNFNKYEYVDIAPKLNELGFNCLAVDLTTGGDFQGAKNETIEKTATPIDRNSMLIVYAAEEEIAAAIDYLYQRYNKQITIWGSSSSATLGIFAASQSEKVNAAIAFSAFDHFRENKTSLSVLIPKIDKPLFMSSARVEASIISDLLKGIVLKENQVHFTPKGTGEHGSKALWNGRTDAKEYWDALKPFLNTIKKI